MLTQSGDALVAQSHTDGGTAVAQSTQSGAAMLTQSGDAMLVQSSS